MIKSDIIENEKSTCFRGQMIREEALRWFEEGENDIYS